LPDIGERLKRKMGLLLIPVGGAGIIVGQLVGVAMFNSHFNAFRKVNRILYMEAVHGILSAPGDTGLILAV
jgi:hypothetical protein